MIDRTEQEIMENWPQSENPVVSVCCTTFNHENYIGEAIDSFLMQKTNFPFEIIVRDDCSTDRTSSILRDYVHKYPDLIKPIYEAENQYSKGVKAMPVVYKKAVGAYFALCEGDDYWTDPLKLQKQVNFLQKNAEYVVTYSDIQGFDSDGDLKRSYGGAKRDLEKNELQKCTSISTMTACFRNVLGEVPPEFNSTRMADLFTWSLLGHFGKGKFISDIGPSKYRVHDGGIFSKKSDTEKLRMWLITSGALYSYYDRIGNQELSDYFLESNTKASIQLYGFSNLLKLAWKRVSIFLKKNA
ncbi:MAG: glycosyltransferase family 2 protein [Gammaproteobacteria bacterium]|nr:MAG: glycosyltransferase family 2 protein [Gammaproteobacteria bacterium]